MSTAKVDSLSDGRVEITINDDSSLVNVYASAGGVPEAPTDGLTYGRNDGAWVEVQTTVAWDDVQDKPEGLVIDLDYTHTDNNYTDADVLRLANTSGTNTGDQDLSGLVPYTGANQDVDLGTHSVAGSGVKLNTTNPLVVSNPGEIGWNATDGTVNIKLLNNTTLQAGQELHIYGKASGAISNRDVVQFAGVQGNHILIKKAVQSEINVNPFLIVGVATDNISNGSFGYVTYFGKVNDVFTTGWSLADLLYFDSAGSTAGAMVNAAPAAPNRKILLAAVIKLATGASENGIIMVRPTFGVKMSDLDDFDGTDTTILDTDVIAKKNGSVWKTVTWANVKTVIGGTFESLSNKKTTLADNSDTYYPSQKAVKTAVDAKQDTLSIATDTTPVGTDMVLSLRGTSWLKTTFTNVITYLSGTFSKLSGGNTFTGVQSMVEGIKAATIYPAADSTTALRMTKADGATNVVVVDTTNKRVGIGNTPSYNLDVTGTVNASGAFSSSANSYLGGIYVV